MILMTTNDFAEPREFIQNVICPQRNLVHLAPRINCSIDLIHSVDPLKAVSVPKQVPAFLAILKFRYPSKYLHYNARHGSLTKNLGTYPFRI